MNNELVERYIYAVTKGLPKKTRADIEKELRTLIDDMLEERCGDITPTEKDIKVVLTELGTPQELASKYSPDGDKCLIGPPYFHQYKMVMSIVFLATLFGLTVALIISAVTEQTELWYGTVFSWIGTITAGLMYAFGAVTLIFAIFQRKGIKIDTGIDALENLPPVPQKKAEISTAGTIFEIAFSIVFCILFLAVPQVFCVMISDDGQLYQVFNSEFIHSVWYAVIAFTALGIIRDCFKLHEGRYTKKLMAVTIVTDILSIPAAIVFLCNKQIINSQFVEMWTKLFEKEDVLIGNVMGSFNLIFFGVIVFALVIDMIDTSVKALRYDG